MSRRWRAVSVRSAFQRKPSDAVLLLDDNDRAFEQRESRLGEYVAESIDHAIRLRAAVRKRSNAAARGSQEA